jgi:hypothetical protein
MVPRIISSGTRMAMVNPITMRIFRSRRMSVSDVEDGDSVDKACVAAMAAG